MQLNKCRFRRRSFRLAPAVDQHRVRQYIYMVNRISKLFRSIVGSSQGREVRKMEKFKAFVGEFERCLVVANLPTQEGFYLFESEQSYEVFKWNRELGCTTLDSGGVGVPILFIVDNAASLSSVSGISPSFLVYEFALRPSKEPKVGNNCVIVMENNGLSLHRTLFCEIYRRQQPTGADYRFVFVGPGMARSSHTMSKSDFKRDMFTYVEGVPVGWFYCTSIVNEHDDYRLQAAAKGGETGQVQRNVTSPRGIIAYYSRTFKNFQSRKVFKQANIFIGNSEPVPISMRPSVTELITCQALLIHYVEYQIRSGNAKKNTTWQTNYMASGWLSPYS